MTTKTFQDILDELEQRKANPTLKDRWEDYIYYPLLRLWRDYNPRQIYREVKWFLQRGKRGWADCDTWSLDWYLSGWLPDALRHLAKHTHGYPSEFYVEGGNSDEGFAKWQAILEKMAAGFEAYKRAQEGLYEAELGPYPLYGKVSDSRFYKARRLRVRDERLFDEGIELFVRYFENLWD